MGEVCPGVVDLECEGVDLTLMEWRYTTTVTSGPAKIIAFTSNHEVNKTYSLSVNLAFISTQLTSISENSLDVRLANFTSILTINVFQLKQQNITEIQCGEPGTGNFAVKRINITIIKDNLPEAPVITAIHASYQDTELSMLDIFWEKIVSFHIFI